MDDAGRAFARRVVSALMNLVDNRDLQRISRTGDAGTALH
jgi:hypothetical protein